MSSSTLRPPSAARPVLSSSRLAADPNELIGARRLHTLTVKGVGWACLAMPVVLLLAESGLDRFANLGSALSAVGILAGLVATNALMLMLLLAARVPLIDRALGQPRATSLHSTLGNWVVGGLGVHAVFLLLGGALLDGQHVVGEFVLLWNSTGDFLLAVAGTALLLVVVVSSIAAARRRLPYEVWHVIHLLSYAAVGLSIPHMFSMSGLLGEGSWQRTYWVALLVLTGGALLVHRVIQPLATSFRHRLRVTSVTPAGPDALSIEFSGRRLDRLNARAGQYLHWRFLTPQLWWHQHPFSLSAAPSPTRLRITVRRLGRGSQALIDHLRPGVRVMVEGPYGIFSELARTSPALTLIGAGIGIAPIRALLEEAAFEPGRATVILRASHPDGLYLHDEIERLCRDRGARLVTLVGGRAFGRWLPAGQGDRTLLDIVPDVADTDLYVCGPEGFVRSVTAEARLAGVPRGRINTEEFSW